CEKKHVYGFLPGTLLIRQQHLPLSGYASLTHPEISYLQKQLLINCTVFIGIHSLWKRVVMEGRYHG
ncbi:TPA: hypothetical protein ACIBLS_004428, partial [Salmonella enterica subsp. enterica serovar Aberdeen]